MIDQRSYCGPNTPNRQTTLDDTFAFLGPAQLRWLTEGLVASRVTYGAPLGRELELASLFGAIKRHEVKNVVWVTADVHYASATRYDPASAQFGDFAPFWEFVAGPINAGTFGPGEIDRTFGPNVKYVSVPSGMKQNRRPTEGMQYFSGDHRPAAGVAAVLPSPEETPVPKSGGPKKLEAEVFRLCHGRPRQRGRSVHTDAARNGSPRSVTFTFPSRGRNGPPIP